MNINESQEEESLVVVDTNNQQQQQSSSPHFGEGQQGLAEQSRPWSLQSSLSAASSDPAVRVLGTPISDISEDENQKPRMLVDAYGKRIDEEEEEEERASLRDFEEQERQIARQLAIEDEEKVGGGEGKEVEEEEEEELLKNPQQQLPPQSPPIPTHARNLFPESLQNRQFNSSQILNDESCSNSIIEEDRQQHVGDVQRSPTISNRSSPVGGYPIDYSADPPPYTSSPPRVGGRLFVGNRLNTTLATGIVPIEGQYDRGISERENEESDEGTEHEEEPEEDNEDEQESSGAYTVPSPSLTVEDGSKPPPPTLVNSSSSNFREALGNSVSMAGGVAAAVIASRGATMSTASPRYQPDSASASPRPVLIEGARTVASLVSSSNRIPSIPQPEYPQTSPREQQKREPAITTPTSNVRNIQQQRHPPNAELKALFSLTEAYIAERIDIEPTLKPFQIDYVPAVGDVDPFIKVPRQDEIQAMGADWLWTGLMAVHPNEDLQLGLTVLDEPAAIQSDPAIVDLRLHQLSGKSGASVDAPVKKLSRADKNAKQIDRWIQSVKELRRTKPPDRVHYGKPMPSIESLMQEWPQSVEQNLKGMKLLLNDNLDAALEDYADICLSLIDIPVHKNRLDSLHVLFSLYAEFRNSQHFKNLALGGSRQGFNNGNDDDLEITEQLLLNNTSSTIDHLVVDDDGEIK